MLWLNTLKMYMCGEKFEGLKIFSNTINFMTNVSQILHNYLIDILFIF